MPRDFLQPWAEPLTLYPFRFRDALTGKWVRARYVAERGEIADALQRVGDHRGARDSQARRGRRSAPGSDDRLQLSGRR